MASRGVWGVEVRSLDKGDVLYGHDAGKLMMPASNMKVLTLAAAAETLGWDYRYTTTLETTGTIDGGVLHGDLIVRGTGDPTINTRGSRAKHGDRRVGRGADRGRHPPDRRAHHRQRSGVRRRGARRGMGVGLPAVQLRRAGGRAPVQREHRCVDGSARNGRGAAGERDHRAGIRLPVAESDRDSRDRHRCQHRVQAGISRRRFSRSPGGCRSARHRSSAPSRS